jgi:hypothetical protein
MDIADDGEIAFPLVTRVEVVDWTSSASVGRVLVRYGVTAFADVQDEGRTLKIFLQDPKGS